MCGRTACTLAPDILCRACTYKDPTGDGGDNNGRNDKFRKPVWRDHAASKQSGMSYTYFPSTNMAPTRFTPVMVMKREEGTGNEYKEREITPMMFGMIPHYHKGPGGKNHGMSTNNCRLEGIAESKLYKRAWLQRKFCVVLCQGFYEWKTAGGVGDAKGVKRQPYLIFAPQKEGNSAVKAEDWEQAKCTEDGGWDGPELLKMAGLWDVWRDPTTGDEVSSYTIITMESNETLSWLHHRMPAILDSDEKVTRWLEAGKRGLGDNEILGMLTPTKMLSWHKVNGKVGNSRCQDGDCMVEVATGVEAKSTFMDKWLIKKTLPVKVKQEIKGEEEGDEEDQKDEKVEMEPSTKRVKTEIEEN